MQQVTLGAKDPWCAKEDISDEYPKLGDGVYVGAGAKILGRINVGEWAIIGANAVVTKDIPAAATVVGYNQIIGAGQTETSKQATAELDTKLR
jgi:serine O-acetyltransferase